MARSEQRQQNPLVSKVFDGIQASGSTRWTCEQSLTRDAKEALHKPRIDGEGRQSQKKL